GPLIGTKSGALGSWNYSIATLVGLGSASVTFGSSNSLAPSSGSQMAKLSAPTLAGVISTVDLNQTLAGVTLIPYTTYTLTFDMAGSADLVKVLSSVSASITVAGSKVATL